jgi:Kef-type K+ transport system membrane component KefB
MTMFELLVRALPVLLALAGTLLAAWLAGALAARFGQPRVIAEIAAGMIIGAVVSTHGGEVHRLTGPLKLIGAAGLALFLVGAAHELRTGLEHSRDVASRTQLGSLAAGSLVVPAVTGATLAGWIIVAGGARLRGTAPAASFVLMTMIALSVTAVPVLARILADRHMTASADGRLSMAAAIAIDAVSWPLLTLAIAIKASDGAGAVRPAVVLAVAVTGATVLYFALRTPVAGKLYLWSQLGVPVAIALAGLAAAATTEHYGLTEVLGAVLVGLVIPPSNPDVPWDDSVRAVSRWGTVLVPVYFVVIGMSVLNGPSGSISWLAAGIGTALAFSGKVTGGYLGGRLGGRPHASAVRLGVLMNTRGMTEIVMLQAGYSAGILTAALYAALLVMALVTTALTVPLLMITERRWGAGKQLAPPEVAIGVEP